MTVEEVRMKYHIPLPVLSEYESWGLRSSTDAAGEAPYTDGDIEKLSTMVTLYDMGFTQDEVKKYMKLLVSSKDTKKERLQMLSVLRGKVMNDIHQAQKNIDCLDYFRYQLQHDKE